MLLSVSLAAYVSLLVKIFMFEDIDICISGLHTGLLARGEAQQQGAPRTLTGLYTIRQLSLSFFDS